MSKSWETYNPAKIEGPDWRMRFDAGRPLSIMNYDTTGYDSDGSAPTLLRIQAMLESGFFTRIEVSYRGESVLNVYYEEIPLFLAWMRQIRVDELREAIRDIMDDIGILPKPE